ncbi:MAG TPA: hypothetical protein VLJ62_24450, partial [Burkholderiaceae bacterium]|nr:hypothetical protein [Burkholderiaceae bacterium]
LWRLRSQHLWLGAPGAPADMTTADFISARLHAEGFWHMHPAGVDSPLFNTPRTETGGSAITQAAREENASAPLRELALHAELERLRAGQAEPVPRFMTERDPVLRCFVQLAGETLPVEVPREDICICEIPDTVELAIPTPRVLALDLRRGRIGFPAALEVERVWLHAAHGSVADIGGGPYERGTALRAASRAADGSTAEEDQGGFFDPEVWQVGVSHLLPDDGGGTLLPTLRAAVEAWNTQPAGRTGVIVLMDSLSEIDTASALEIQIPEASQLLVVAGQWPLQPIPGAPPGSVQRVPGRFEARQVRAHWQGRLQVRGTADADAANPGALFLHGLLLQGPLQASGPLGQLELAHCTLLPDTVLGAQGLTVGNDSPRLQLRLRQSLCAPVAVAGPVRGVEVADSVVGLGLDSGASEAALDAPEAALDLQRATFLGAVNALSLNASNCIFDAPAVAERRQIGCVRFCYVPPASQVPRRYRCQPQMESETRIAALPASATAAEKDAVRAEVEATVRPLFVSRSYGDPALGQLELRCPVQIRTGAASGAEMGACEHLQQPQREANLRDALNEYLRLGLAASVHFAN